MANFSNPHKSESDVPITCRVIETVVKEGRKGLKFTGFRFILLGIRKKLSTTLLRDSRMKYVLLKAVTDSGTVGIEVRRMKNEMKFTESLVISIR